MRVAWQCVIAALTLLTVSSAFAACEYPEDITVPEGANANEEEMLAGQQQVKQYMANMQAYLDCIDADDAALNPEELTDEQRKINVERYNAAVDAMETVAAQYNEQVKAYKANSN